MEHTKAVTVYDTVCVWRTGSEYFDTSDVGRIEILSSKSHRNQEDDGFPGLTGCSRAARERPLTQLLHILYVDWTHQEIKTEADTQKTKSQRGEMNPIIPISVKLEFKALLVGEVCFWAQLLCYACQNRGSKINWWQKWLTGAILCNVHSHIGEIHWCCHSFPETELNYIKLGCYMDNWAGV